MSRLIRVRVGRPPDAPVDPPVDPPPSGPVEPLMSELDSSLHRTYGYGYSSRPQGDEFQIPEGYPHGGNTGLIGAGVSTSELTPNNESGRAPGLYEYFSFDGINGFRQAGDYTIRYCLFEDWDGGHDFIGMIRGDEESRLLVEDCTIRGGVGWSRLLSYVASLETLAVTFRRCNIYGSGHWLRTGPRVRVEHCFLHDLITTDGTKNDGIQHTAGNDIYMRNNTVLGPYQSTGAGAFRLQGDNSSNLILADNFIAGSGNAVSTSGSDDNMNNLVYQNLLCQTGSFAQGTISFGSGNFPVDYPDSEWWNVRETDGTIIRENDQTQELSDTQLEARAPHTATAIGDGGTPGPIPAGGS